jgi:bifunctional DNA-binding transcriptional regulator/antitoxin component of YhaV-PrlF toxin-antitoxin module
MPPLTLTVSAKGQVTLRKNVLAHLGIKAGGKLTVETLPGGRLALQAARRTGKFSGAFNGRKRQGGPAFTIGEMNEAIATTWAGAH